MCLVTQIMTIVVTNCVTKICDWEEKQKAEYSAAGFARNLVQRYQISGLFSFFEKFLGGGFISFAFDNSIWLLLNALVVKKKENNNFWGGFLHVTIFGSFWKNSKMVFT